MSQAGYRGLNVVQIANKKPGARPGFRWNAVTRNAISYLGFVPLLLPPPPFPGLIPAALPYPTIDPPEVIFRYGTPLPSVPCWTTRLLPSLFAIDVIFFGGFSLRNTEALAAC